MPSYALTQNAFSAAVTLSPGQALSVQNLGSSDASIDVYGSHDGSNYSRVGSAKLTALTGLDPVARIDMEGCAYAKLLLVSSTGVTVDATAVGTGNAASTTTVALTTDATNRITSATTTVVLGAPGTLDYLILEAAPTGTVTVYDNTTAAGTIVTILPISAPAGKYEFNRAMANGITVVTSAADRVVVGYRGA